MSLAAERKHPRVVSRDSLEERARWFCRVRWAAVIGHALVFLSARLLLGLHLAWAPVIAVELLLILSNAILYCSVARIRSNTPLGLVLLLDVGLLTALLAAYGGHMNPFSMVYLIQVVLAALFIGHLWTWVVALSSTVGFSALFFLADGHGLHQHHTQGNFDLHLQGMLVAFVLISFLIAGFVSRMRLAIDLQERQLMEQAAHEQRLASLTQLAAGAAHELGTPFATMSVILSELRQQEELRKQAEVMEDIECLREQLSRCEQILRRMAPAAGDISGEMPANCDALSLSGRVRDILAPEYRERLTVTVESDPGALYLPVESVAQTLASLVKNGFDASSIEHQVQMRISGDTEDVVFDIVDQGTGMEGTLLKRIGEPFFTTKEPGKGTGLGIFLCRLLVSRMHGALDFDSEPGKGTRVRMQLPRRVRWAHA